MERATIVTGGSGLIGMYAGHYLKNPIVMMGRSEVDLTNREALEVWVQKKLDMLAGRRVDIVHCAANPLVGIPATEFGNQLKSNVLAFSNLLEVLSQYKILTKESRVLNMSSATVYGGQKSILHDTPVMPETYYAVTKLASEAVGIAARAIHGFKTVSLRLVAVVGREASHGMVPDVVDKVMKAHALSAEKISLLSNSTKPFIHVQDIHKLIKLILNSNDIIWKDCPSHINVGPEDNYNVQVFVHDLWYRLNEAKNTKIPIPTIEWNGSWNGDVKEFCYLSNKLAKSYFGWNPGYPTSKSAVMEVAENIMGLPLIQTSAPELPT